MTRLACYFYSASGTSLASPHIVEHADEETAYATARAFRDALQLRRGVKVLLHTQEEPEGFVTRQEEDDDGDS